ncbi:MAG: (d)CMP kinase [Victivallales bacterium]|nr:(d)CMP kinase [Victivallales bacterium]
MSNCIAIDGPAASGKSTIAKLLAKKLNIAYINTGNLYRAVALAAIRAGRDLARLDREFLETLKLEYTPNESGDYVLKLNGKELEAALRTPEVATGASLVATESEVRDYLLGVQRNFAGKNLIVMEGRDIGTVVFPDAEYKFFVTATPEERARRRLAQNGETADGATLSEVARELAARDKQDSERPIAPLKPAADAVLIDTTNLNIEAVIEKIIGQIKRSN